MEFTQEYIEAQRKALPELPEEKKCRFVDQYGLSEYDAEALTNTRAFADYFEDAVKAYNEPKTISNWMTGDFTKALNSAGIDISESKVKPADLASMLRLIADGTISGKIAKSVFEEMFETGASADDVVNKKGLTQISSDAEIYPVVDRVLTENPDVVRKIAAGDDRAMGFLVGQVMKYTQGRANPGAVNKILRDRLAESMKG
jgi:aspartyl-tRNA(Asn)/glutamyl-tRNA(Gln) amidotransferase subunit B